jgi:hypothetical protein
MNEELLFLIRRLLERYSKGENLSKFNIIDQIANSLEIDRKHGGNGDRFNLYPSEHYGRCHQSAVFISLTGKRWNLPARDKITFPRLFELIIQHCQGTCSGKTKYVTIITDNWDDNVSHKWQTNIDTMLHKDNIFFEVFIITGQNVAHGKL